MEAPESVWIIKIPLWKLIIWRKQKKTVNFAQFQSQGQQWKLLINEAINHNKVLKIIEEGKQWFGSRVGIFLIINDGGWFYRQL